MPVDMLRGFIYGRQGEAEKAKDLFRSALTLLEDAARSNPHDPRIFSSLGITYAGLGRYQEAIEAGRRAVDMYPVSLDAMIGIDRLVNLAQIYAMTGETKEALKTIRSVLSTPGIYSIYHFDLSPSYESLRDTPGYQVIREEYGRVVPVATYASPARGS